ncbi:MAG: VOC family protein [Candidatus Dormibacteria bacterium]
MTKLRTGDPWMPARDYGHSLTGLSVNLIVRDISLSLPFYSQVLGLQVLYHDPDFAAIEGAGGTRIMLHADHTYEAMPWASALASDASRGLGAEIRLLVVDADAAAARAAQLGIEVLIPPRDAAHGWHECYLRDPDGYVFAVGTPV